MIDLLAIREQTDVAEIAYHDELDSTNSFALTHLQSADVASPWLVIAERQTKGRGRGANQWWADEGALTFSLAIEANDLTPEQICKASLSTGLAVCQAIERFVPAGDLALKWPNDVYLEGKKVCGILIERPSGRSDFIVIGVGINVNNSIEKAPNQIQESAVSLSDCLQFEVDRTAVLIECLHQIDHRIRSIRLGDSMLLDQWRAYCMLSGRQVVMDLYEKEIEGNCRGIDSSGALLVESNGEINRCVGGIVKRFS